MRYKVIITEVLQTEILIEAESYIDAIGKARDLYERDRIIMTADDRVETSISAHSAE